MAIRAVVFDVGETLVAEGRMWTVWAEVSGVPAFTFMAALGAAIARGNHREVFPLLGIDPEPLRPRLRARFGGYRPEDLYVDAAPTVLALRRSGYRVGVAGNQRAWATPALRAAGLEAERYGTGEDWGVAKPDPRFFAQCCRLVEAAPAEVAYVGDDPVRDIAAARASGLASIWVRRGPWALLGDRAQAARADAAVDSLAQLPGILPGLGA